MSKFDSTLLQALEALEKAAKEFSKQQDFIDKQQIDDVLAAAQAMLNAAAEAQKYASEECAHYSQLLADKAAEAFKAALAEGVEQFAPDQFKEFFEQASAGYEEYIQPLLDKYQENIADNKTIVDNSSYIAIANLGMQIYNTSKEVYKLQDQMQPQERIMALAGTLLMCAGICLMIAALANPQIGIPLFATFAMVQVGVKLCQWSTKRLTNDAINDSLTSTAAKAKETEGLLENKKTHTKEPARTSLNFSSNNSTASQAEGPTIVEQCTKFIKNLFK